MKSLSFGVFDGAHLGHREILKTKPSVVYIFNKQKNLIYPLSKRIELIEKIGIKKIEIIEPTNDFLNTTALDFVNNYIKAKEVDTVILGFDAKFGKNRTGDSLFLKKNSIKTRIISEQKLNNLTISSTNIRKFIKNGEIKSANEMLGTNYSLEGVVVKGAMRGRTIGFPTANLKVDTNLILPKNGVYSGKLVDGKNTYPLGISIGPNKTFNEDIIKIEGNVPGRTDLELYGKKVTFIFNNKIRDIKKFDSKNALIKQLKKDTSFVNNDIF